MKLEITIKASKQSGYNNMTIAKTTKTIEIKDTTAVKASRDATERALDAFLIDLKPAQTATIIAEKESEEKKKKESSLDFLKTSPKALRL